MNQCGMLMPGRGGEAVVCPKPRRVGLLSGAINEPVRSYGRQLSPQAENSDSKAAPDLLDLILAKGVEDSGTNTATQVSMSPPFFCGSPPSRVSNPLIQDARFKDPINASPQPSSPGGAGSSLSPTSSRKGGCGRANFGNDPAVRIEGFDCLDRDRRRNCSIPTLA